MFDQNSSKEEQQQYKKKKEWNAIKNCICIFRSIPVHIPVAYKA